MKNNTEITSMPMATAFSKEGSVTVFNSGLEICVFNSISNKKIMGENYNINAIENKEIFDKLAQTAKLELIKINALMNINKW